MPCAEPTPPLRDRAVIVTGDLVRVALPKFCCDSIDDLGFIFTIAEFVTADECGACGAKYAPRRAAVGAGMNGLGVVVERLRKIPPLEELENVQSDTIAESVVNK